MTQTALEDLAARERVAQLAGPGDQAADEERAAYWRELAAWPEWNEWVTDREPALPDWLQA
jgi:hypothetical protein